MTGHGIQVRSRSTRQWAVAGALLIGLIVLVSIPVFAQSLPPSPLGEEADYLHARKLDQRGMSELALAEFERFLSRWPRSERAPDVAQRIAELYRDEGELQSARTAYHRAAVLAADTTQIVSALHHAAAIDLELADTLRAVETLYAISVLYPDVESLPRTLLTAGRLMIEAGRGVEAERMVAGLLREYPGTPWEVEARLILARSYAMQGDLPAAIQQARGVARGTASDSLRLEAGVWIGRWERDNGDPVAAEEILAQVLGGMEQVPGVEAVALELGQLRARMGNRQGAGEAYQRVLAGSLTERQQWMGHEQLADLQFVSGVYDSALIAYQALPDTVAALRRAWCAEYVGRGDEARAALSVATQVGDSTHRAVAAVQRARSLLLIPAADSLSGDRDTRLQRGYEQLKTAFKLAPSPALREWVRYSAGSLLASQDEATLALGFLTEHQPLFPVQTPLADDLTHLRMTLALALGQPDVATTAASDLISRFPASPYAEAARQVLDQLAGRLTPEQTRERTVRWLAAGATTPGDPALLVEAAETAWRGLADPELAVELLTPVLTRDLPDSLLATWRPLASGILWARWLDETGVERGLGGSHVALAQEHRRLFDALWGADADLNDRPDEVWRLNHYLIAGEATAVERVRLSRQLWANYLELFPASPHAQQARYQLARARLTTLTGEPADRIDSLGVALLHRVGEGDLAERVTRQAISDLREMFIAGQQPEVADSLAGLLLSAPPSPERTRLALDRVRQRAGQAGADLSRELAVLVGTDGDVDGGSLYHPAVLADASLLVDVLLDRSDVAGAARVTDAARAESPADPASLHRAFVTGERLFARARMEEATGDTSAALLDYTAFLAKSSGSGFATEARLRLGHLYDELGHWNRALPVFEELLANDDGSDELQPVRRQLARWAYSEEDFAQARQWARNAVEHESEPDSQVVYDELAVVCLYQQGELERGRTEARAFSDRWDDHPQRDEAMARFTLEKGRWLSSQRRYGDAMDAYKDVVRRYDDTSYPPAARYEMARDYLEQGETEKAFEMLLEVAEDAPGHPIMAKVYWLLGNHYASTGDYFDAFRQYEKVLSDSAYVDSWPEVLANQIRAYKEAGFYDGQLRAARRFLELYPDHPDAFDQRMNLALAYHELGHYDLAISHFRRAMLSAGDEDYAACMFYIAEATEKAGRLNEAVGEYLRVVHINRPTKLKWGVTALYNAARVLERLDEPGRAVSLYKDIVRREGLGSPFGRKAQEQVDRIGE